MVQSVFQRGYVPNREQLRGLFESLCHGHPVGSLLVWTTRSSAARRTRPPVPRAM